LSALILALLSLAVFGLEIWRVWLELMTGFDEAYRAWLANGRLNGISVFACIAWLGAPSRINVDGLALYLKDHWLGVLASLSQAAAIATAAAAVFWVFRRGVDDALRLAVLLAATMLAAPHVSNSDAVLLALSTSL